MKKIRLTESQFIGMVKECVKQAINEIGDTDNGQYKLGAVATRANARAYKTDDEEKKKRYNQTYDDAVHTAWNGIVSQGGYLGKDYDKLAKSYSQGCDYGYKKGGYYGNEKGGY